MYDQAAELYHKVIALDEDADLAYYCLGFIYGAKKDYAKSLENYNIYLGRRSEDGQALAERALVHLMSGDRESALNDIERADKMDRKNPAIKGIYKTILKTN